MAEVTNGEMSSRQRGPATPLLPMWAGIVKESKEFICGWGAVVMNVCITFPLNKVTFRQMAHNLSLMGAVRQLSSEGFFRLYRGVLPPLMQKSTSGSIMFGTYEKFRKPLEDKQVHPYAAKTAAAVAAGTVEGILVPFERVQTLLQHQRYHKDLINMKHTIQFLWKDHGARELYRGLVPVLLRNGPSTACYFILRDDFIKMFPQSENYLTMLVHQFTVGALIGALCSTVFYPCNVLKVHMQSRIGGPFQSVFTAFREIYKDRGNMRGIFRGVHLNFTRSCIGWGVINASYEFLTKIVPGPKDESK